VVLYARSDVMSVNIPATSGGCDKQHIRPVRSGVPDRSFRLDCPPCEAFLKGERRPKILNVIPGDPKNGIPAKQMRVADADPMWSSTPDTIPLTPDEIGTRHVKIEKGEQQLRALESLLALKAGGIDLTSRPEVLFYLRESGLPGDMLQGAVLCADGHDNISGAKFCAECGTSMAARAAIAPEPDIPLDALHPQTLRKMCRRKGLPDRGTREQMIARLAA
jgi:hypothetical protein